MSTKEFHRLLELHLMALETQRQHMLIVRDSHQSWIIKTDDAEINRIRRDLIDLIEEMVDRYGQLLEALQRQQLARGKTTVTEGGEPYKLRR
jgi:hypothetical protein